MSDYILDKMNNMQILYESISNYKRYFIALMRREYIIRLILAILWDSCFQKCTSKEKKQVVQKIFWKKPSLGDFLQAINTLSTYSSEKEMFKKIYNYTCSYVIFNRNQYDHKISSDVDKMIEVINAWISYIKEQGCCIFSNESEKSSYEYRFLIPVKEKDEDRVLCICFEEKGITSSVFRKREVFQKDSGKRDYLGQLYYSMADWKTEKEFIYKLSPFIHYYKDPVQGVFTLYCSTISRSASLVTDARSLFDEQLNDEKMDDILSAKSCRHEFVLGDLQALHESDNFYISAFNNVMVNKSSYREFQMVANNQYKYSESIVQDYCNQVYCFCREKKSQLFIIAGGGGLGKTALLWNIVQKIMVNNLKGADYDLLIFLSAKQNYLVNESDVKPQIYEEVESDITNCESLKYKLWKYVYDLNDKEMADSYQEIDDVELVNQIENQGKSILLMVDDLDTLATEEQESICHLVTSFSAERVKTIITTRNINSNGHKIVMQRMDKENSVKFAKWLIKTKYQREGSYWMTKMDETSYQNNVYELSRGIPVFIQTWVLMVVQGVNCFNVKNVFTERDCIKYLYYTAKNQLDIKESQLIYILRKIRQLCGMQIFGPFFLYLISSVETTEERDQCLKSLISFQLLQDNGNNTYSLFDFDYTYIDISDYGYYESEIYQLIFKSMKSSPKNWNSQFEYMDILIQCLEKISLYDNASALLLDKLCSEYGSRNCSGIQYKKVIKLQQDRDSISDIDAKVATMMGEWDGESYDAILFERTLNKVNEFTNQRVAIEILGMIVNCCDKKITEILDSDEVSDPYIREFMGIWSRIKTISNNSPEIKELKRKFANRLHELEDV